MIIHSAASSIMAIRHVFVYGSLRPDDDSGQAWTKEAVRGLRAQKATLSKARLFHDQYACAVLDSAYDKNHSILGYVLSTNDEELFKEKLALFDKIEGYKGPDYSNLYDRTILDVELLPSNEQNPTSVEAYVYHGTNRCNRENPIPSGDWLQRNSCLF